MTNYDLIVIGLLAISGLAGFFRGGAREMVTVLSFLLAALAALYGLRFSGPVARAAIDPDWAGNVAAILVVFVAAYIVLRLLGAGLARRVKETEVLGALDRFVGLGFGLIRALVVLGAFHLMFHAATPPDRVPRWIAGAKLYPLSAVSAQVLKAFAPRGLDMAGRLKPALDDAVEAGTGDTGAGGRYDARERSQIDDLVEKSR